MCCITLPCKCIHAATHWVCLSLSYRPKRQREWVISSNWKTLAQNDLFEYKIDSVAGFRSFESFRMFSKSRKQFDMNENFTLRAIFNVNSAACNGWLIFVQNIYWISSFLWRISHWVEKSLRIFSTKALTFFHSIHRWNFHSNFPYFRTSNPCLSFMCVMCEFFRCVDFCSFAIVIIRMPTVAVNTSQQVWWYRCNTCVHSFMCTMIAVNLEYSVSW